MKKIIKILNVNREAVELIYFGVLSLTTYLVIFFGSLIVVSL